MCDRDLTLRPTPLPPRPNDVMGFSTSLHTHKVGTWIVVDFVCVCVCGWVVDHASTHITLLNQMPATKLSSRARTDLTLKSATPPISHLMTLYQRYDSLRNSIALLREQTLHTPGIEDWPSVQTHYANLLSHTFSIAAALQSATPHFLTSQLATLHSFFENEAQDANLFGEDTTKMDTLLAGDNQGAWPPIEDKDPQSQLPALAVHPCQPIPDTKLNWLGSLLSTVPEMDIATMEAARIAEYDQSHKAHPPDSTADGASRQDTSSDAHTAAAASLVATEIHAHDTRCLQAMRSWYHMLYAPDEHGDTYDFAMRVADESQPQPPPESDDVIDLSTTNDPVHSTSLLL